MRIQRLHIEQQLIQIRADSQFAALSIEMPKRQMQIERQNARMTVQKEPPAILLDMQDFRNNYGPRDMSAFLEISTAKAYDHAEQGIKQIALDGDFVAQLPSGGNSIAQLARSRMLEVSAPEMNSGEVPYGPVKMEGNTGSLNIDWSRHDLQIKWDEMQRPLITVEPKASVNFAVVQEPYIECTVEEYAIPSGKGREIDTEA